MVWVLGENNKIGMLSQQSDKDNPLLFETNISTFYQVLIKTKKPHTIPRLAVKTNTEIISLPNWAILPYEKPLIANDNHYTITKETLKIAIKRTIQNYNQQSIRTCSVFATILIGTIATITQGVSCDIKIPIEFNNTNIDELLTITKNVSTYGIPIFTKKLPLGKSKNLKKLLDSGFALLIPLPKNTILAYNKENKQITTTTPHVLIMIKTNNQYIAIDNNGIIELSKSTIKYIANKTNLTNQIIIGVKTTMLNITDLTKKLYQTIRENYPNITFYRTSANHEITNESTTNLSTIPNTDTLTINIASHTPDWRLPGYLVRNYSHIENPETIIVATPKEKLESEIKLTKKDSQLIHEFAQPSQVSPELRPSNETNETKININEYDF